MTSSNHEGQAREVANLRIVRRVRAVVWVAWGALVLWIMTSAAGENPVGPSPALRVLQLSLVPEGWAFFTRDPREPRTIAFQMEGSSLRRLTFTNTSPRSLFGLSRSARAFDGELAGLLSPVLDDTWAACDGDPSVCASRLDPLTLTNWSTTRFVCGDVVVVRSPPVPWAWVRSRERIHMPSKVLRVTVDCGQPQVASYR